MSKGNETENDFVAFMFNSIAMPDYGGNVILNLHTADPGEAGTAASFVANYIGYTAINVIRDASGWIVNGSSCGNAALIQFPTCTGVGDDQIVTHLSMVGTTGEGFRSGALAQPFRVTNLAQPQFAIAAIQYQED